MSRQIGLQKFTVGELLTDTETETTYDTPMQLERDIMAKIAPSLNSEDVYSEDGLEETIETFDKVDVEIEVNQLSLKSRAFLQGDKIVKGTLIESADSIAPTVALMFRSKKSNGKYRYVVLFKGKFSKVEDEYETVADKPKPQTAKLKATFFARESDNNYRLIADEDEEGVVQATLDAWFDAVPTVPTEA